MMLGTAQPKTLRQKLDGLMLFKMVLVVILAVGVTSCLCGRDEPPPGSPDSASTVAASTTTPQNDGVRQGVSAEALHKATPSPASTRANSGKAPRGPWIARVLIVGEKAYVLRHPTEGERPPSESSHIELFEARALMRATPEHPMNRPQPITLVGRTGSCAIQATHVSRVYLGCELPSDNPEDQPTVEYTGRRAMVADVCPVLTPPEGWTMAWAIDGSYQGLELRSSRLEMTEDRQYELDRLTRPYIRARNLTEWLPEQWSVFEVRQIPGLAPQLVVVGGDRDSLTLLAHGERVLDHLEPGLAPRDYFQIGERTYLHMMTPRECHHVYTVVEGRLLPVYQDCLNLWCGDGLL